MSRFNHIWWALTFSGGLVLVTFFSFIYFMLYLEKTSPWYVLFIAPVLWIVLCFIIVRIFGKDEDKSRQTVGLSSLPQAISIFVAVVGGLYGLIEHNWAVFFASWIVAYVLLYLSWHSLLQRAGEHKIDVTLLQHQRWKRLSLLFLSSVSTLSFAMGIYALGKYWKEKVKIKTELSVDVLVFIDLTTLTFYVVTGLLLIELALFFLVIT